MIVSDSIQTVLGCDRDEPQEKATWPMMSGRSLRLLCGPVIEPTRTTNILLGSVADFALFCDDIC